MSQNGTLLKRSDSLQRVLDKVDEPLYDVFLGGSCGKTTWRQDIVIPRLEKIGCSYYDPSSRILFWVVHPSSSSIVTLIEIAHYAGINAPLMVVFLDSPFSHSSFCNKDCGVPEEEVCKSRDFVRNVLAQHSLSVFSTVEDGMDAVQRKLLLSRPYLAHARNKPLRCLYMKERDEYLREQKRKYVRLKFGVCFKSLIQLIVNTVQIRSPLCVVRLLMHIAEMCVLFKIGHQYSTPVTLILLVILVLFTTHVFSMLTVHKPTNRVLNIRPPKPPHYDIYFGGSGSQLSHFSWIDSLAVPKFSRYGFSYMHGGYLINSQWKTKEAIFKECRLILYRLTPNVSIFYAMVELAHMAGKCGDKLIVCLPSKSDYINDLSDKWLMTCTRAACYLEDILNQERIVHTYDINSAIDATLKKARARIRI